MKTLVLLLMILSISLACNAQDLRQTDAAKAACGPFDTVPGVAAQDNNNPGAATVYVVQMANFVGNCFGSCGLDSRIGIDGKWVGSTRRTSFVKTTVAPGVHHLCGAWTTREKHLAQLVALHSLKAEAGQTYYFGLDMIGFTHDGGSVQYALRPLDEDEARMLIIAYPGYTATR